MYYRALVLAVNVYSAIGYSIGRPLKQGSKPSALVALPRLLDCPRFARRGRNTIASSSSFPSNSEPESATNGVVEKSDLSTGTVNRLGEAAAAVVPKQSTLVQLLCLLAYPFVAYFGYMRLLWRPEGNLPRNVKTARLLRWVGQLDDVLLHSGPDDKVKEDAAFFQASSSNENNEEVTSRDSASATSPQSSASTAAAGEMSDLRNACAALASELRAELDAPAVAAAAAKKEETASKEKAANDAELQEVAATSTSASRSKQLVGAPVDGSASTPAPSQAMNKPPSKVATKKATLRPPVRGKELAKRLATGWGLGAACTAWIFSGNLGHAAGLYLLAIVAQLEYYRSVIATGVYPARRIGVVSTTAMYATALWAPHLHELVMPAAATAVMLWFLLLREKPGSISEISSSIMGIFYLGLLPSFWVRLRAAPDLPAITATIPDWLAGASFSPGALAKWWICLAIVSSDVGAYFGGKLAGKTPLSAVGRGAAGRTSPNKTVEGAVAGMAASAAVSALGAWCMGWPGGVLSGGVFGISLAMVALVGDLTASMFKRDAGLKDFGDLLPGHGGVLDRFDSYIFAGPLAFATVKHVLPALAAATKAVVVVAANGGV